MSVQLHVNTVKGGGVRTVPEKSHHSKIYHHLLFFENQKEVFKLQIHLGQ